MALPTGGTAKRELVFHSGAVAMIPLTAEGKIVLVKQFRKPLEQVILEIPAGKIDPGEEKSTGNDGYAGIRRRNWVSCRLPT